MTKRCVITGGPGTGKTSLINRLTTKGYTCFEEISRQITLEARQQGIEQLFLENALLFSEQLLQGRTRQFEEANEIQEPLIFLDRGLPDILAYMDFIGDPYPTHFKEACLKYRYDAVFILEPWLEIYARDAERYETFEEAQRIHRYLVKTYSKFNYELIIIPKDTVDNRVELLLDSLNL
jgi:predicted ATPase